MSDSRNELALRRVLVAMEPPNLSTQTLFAARELAQSLQLELAGLFVEDLNLLRLAALPITREVGAASGAVRTLELGDVERALRTQAEQMRGALSSFAAELNLPWSFRVERGELLERVLAELSEAVAVVFAPAPRKAQIRPSSPAPSAMPSPRKALAVLGATATQNRVLSVAQRLSLAPGATLAVASVTTERPAFVTNREPRRSRLPTHAHVMRLSDTSVDTLADAVRITACDTLVLGSDVFPRQPREFRALLERVRCLVVLVG